jgi:transposase
MKMKKTRRRYDRAFKISVVAELESGKPLAQIAREFIRAYPPGGEMS